MVLLFLLALVSNPGLCFAEQPKEVLQDGIEKALRILEDPVYQNDGQKASQLRELEAVLRQLFDFKEFSRRVLASKNKEFTPKQRSEFSRAFAQFLSNFYLRQVQKRYQNEQVIVLSQKIVSDSKATVNIIIQTKGIEIPVKVWMTNRSRRWKTYNIHIMGISAVKFYRTQIHALLQKKSPEQLIQELKDRVEGQKKLAQRQS
jgi:phospholipid transport system substrate-binding protein